MELTKITEMKVNTMVPSTKAPNRRSINSKVLWVDLYGFRLLYGKNCKFQLPSPYEFVMHWEGEALTPPKKDDPNSKTEWTAAGKAAMRSLNGRQTNFKFRPGIHYIVKEPNHWDDYHTSPQRPEEIYEVLRHTWVLKRRPRPCVPILEGIPVPAPTKSPEWNSRFFLLFLAHGR